MVEITLIVSLHGIQMLLIMVLLNHFVIVNPRYGLKRKLFAQKKTEIRFKY